MNGDFELATKLIEVFRREAKELQSFNIHICHIIAASNVRIADSIQQLLDEHNPKKKKVTDRDV